MPNPTSGFREVSYPNKMSSICTRFDEPTHGKFVHPFPDLLDTLAILSLIHPVDLRECVSVIKFRS